VSDDQRTDDQLIENLEDTTGTEHRPSTASSVDKERRYGITGKFHGCYGT